MKLVPTLTSSCLAGALLWATWNAGYTKGSKEAANRESSAWEALIASGWLNGFKHRVDRWAYKVSSEEVDYITDDYKRHYDNFLEARAKVSEDSIADSLMDNHTETQMKPEEFSSILTEYQRRARTNSQSDPKIIQKTPQ